MQNNSRNIQISITPGTVFLIFFVILLAMFLYEIREFLLVLVSAVIFSLALAPSKRFLERFRVPGTLAVVILYFLVFAIFSFFVYAFLPIISQQFSLFVQSLPNLAAYLRELVAGTNFESLIGADAFNLADREVRDLVKGSGQVLSLTGAGLSTVFGGLVNVLLFLLLTFLFTVKPMVLDTVLFVLTPQKYRRYIEDLWGRSKVKMGQWFKGQLILVVVIGTLTYLAFFFIDLPNALFLAAFAGLMELIPVFGPVIAAIPALLMALSVGDFGLVVLVAVIFVIVQQLESYVLYPLIVSNTVSVSPILVVIGVVIGATLAGFVGIVIAVPVVAVVQEFFGDIRSGKLTSQIQSVSEKSDSAGGVAS